ncbi:hypothetical protein CN918_26035 [Priestia megaterium]|nr:hypothetical protein CN918_26035 [Priestia megaterium]
MKKTVTSLLAFSLLTFGLMSGPVRVMADAAPGDVIISLGEDLTAEQKEKLLAEMKVPENALTTTVSNKEEHEYLGNYISSNKIGTRSLSSSKITLAEAGTGIIVETQHINWVTKEMYTNALATAGVKDAEVYVTAPFDVSGTAALTGIVKAYEVKTGEKIPEETKQIANEEMVTTAKLGDELGQDEATALMTAVKDEIAKDMPKNEEEMQQVVQTQAEKLGLKLDDQQTTEVKNLFGRMKDAGIDFKEVGSQMDTVKEKLKNFMDSDETKNFFEKAGDFVKKVFQAIVDFFNGLFNKDEKTDSNAQA